ncbi:hypothetical protein [Paracoccus pacificus]|uniref:YD repeat-containing protein n=1 Tax=Paracoccus pacificus TaxID=1463598 RepID=A0ABW4R632_9RHOB
MMRNVSIDLGPAAGFAALILALVAPGAVSAGVFTPPEGCTLNMTVQSRSCTVAQHYTCAGDNPGDMRTTYFGPDGPKHISLIDKETRWIETQDPRTGIIDRLASGNADEASFSTLLSTGRDDFDFWTESETGERLHHVGYDKLTGKTMVIDGETLEQTEFSLTTSDSAGQVLWERTGNQFISRKDGRFYGGIERAKDWTGLNETTNDSPVTFIKPGERGFGDTTPQYDCDMQMVNMPGGNNA